MSAPPPNAATAPAMPAMPMPNASAANVSANANKPKGVVGSLFNGVKKGFGGLFGSSTGGGRRGRKTRGRKNKNKTKAKRKGRKTRGRK